MSTAPNPSKLAAYADLFERLLDGTVLLDVESNLILEANSACERVLGQVAEKIIGKSLLSWVEPASQDDFAKALRVAMRRYHPRTFDTKFVVPAPDGQGKCTTIYVEVTACPLRLSDGSDVLQVICHDVSFKRLAEAKMQQLLSDLKAANERLEIISTVDEMTGLHNFRYFKSELQKEHLRAVRFKMPYSIVFCDVDHFKKYNDRNGHPAGDQLLREFAAVLKTCCRSSDQPARYGGEEFAVICPGSNAEGARILAERIRASVEAKAFAFGEHQPLGKMTVSIGVASYPEAAATPEDVLKHADEAVYASKEAGRNRVTLYGAGLPQKKTA